MSITKQQVLDNLDQVKKYISESENEPKVETYSKDDLIQLLKTDVHKFNQVVKLKSHGGHWEDLPKIDNKLDLSNSNLSNSDLSHANLTIANLSNSNLSNSDLSNADLSKANLYNMDLSNANLCRALFYGRGAGLKLKKNQVEDFLLALGFTIKE